MFSTRSTGMVNELLSGKSLSYLEKIVFKVFLLDSERLIGFKSISEIIYPPYIVRV